MSSGNSGSSGKDPMGIKQSKARLSATFRTARLVAVVFGSIVFVLAVILTLISVLIFKANALMAFAGSFTVLCVTLFAFVPTKILWKMNYAMCLQEQGLWAESDELVFADIAQPLALILSGRTPDGDLQELEPKLSQVLITYIRTGEVRSAIKIAEFLHRNAEGNPYHFNTLSALYCESGRYDEGISIARNSLALLQTEGRTASPAAISACIGLAAAYVGLRDVREAHRYLTQLKDYIDASNLESSGGKNADRTDQLVRMEVGKHELDLAFYNYYLGRLKYIEGSPESEAHVNIALEVMKDDSNQRLLSLFYPELNITLADIYVARAGEDNLQRMDNLQKALAYCEIAMQFYKERTRYMGPDYQRCVSMQSWLHMKLGTAYDAGSIEKALETLRGQVEEKSPYVSNCQVLLAECLMHKGEHSKARGHLEGALATRKALYKEGDALIAEVEGMLANCPVAV